MINVKRSSRKHEAPPFNSQKGKSTSFPFVYRQEYKIVCIKMKLQDILFIFVVFYACFKHSNHFMVKLDFRIFHKEVQVL